VAQHESSSGGIIVNHPAHVVKHTPVYVSPALGQSSRAAPAPRWTGRGSTWKTA